MTQVEEFENYKIQEGALLFEGENAISFGCIGTLDGTSNVEEVQKKCEGIVVKSVKRTTSMTISVTGHVKVPASRQLIGLTNDGLETGVYGFGKDTFSKSFIFVAKVLDMEGNIKYIAFPNLENVKGLTIKVNNEATEIEMDDLEFTAMLDDNNMFYYEAYESELDDSTIADKWLTDFSTDLVLSASDSDTE